MIHDEPARGSVPPPWFWSLSGFDRMRAFSDGLSAVESIAVPDLLDLEEERVLPVPAEEQRHPRGRAHAADAHHLARDVDDPELLQQRVALVPERAGGFAQEALDVRLDAIALHRVGEVVEPNDQRGSRDDAQLAVDDLRELAEGLQAVPTPSPGDNPVEPLAHLSAEAFTATTATVARRERRS